MKLIKITLVAFISTSLLTSCVDDKFDVPPVNIPHVDFSANTTIAKMKANFKSYMDTTGMALDSIEEDVIIKGIVVANDESGNFYKKMVIQDETGAIEISIDKSSLYNEYRLGQTIYIKCRGLFLGDYRNLTQLGYKYNNAIGRIPESMIKKHVYVDGLPVALPQPKVLKLTELKDTFISMLCQFDTVYFPEAGQMLAPNSDDATNRDLKDLNENGIFLRTSKYANFASNKLPNGTGTVVGILSIYSGDWQFYIRDMNDLVSFGGPAPQMLINELFDTDPLLQSDPTKKWTQYSVSSNKNWYWSSQYLAMVANGYGGDAPSNDWFISPEIDLTGCTETKLSFRSWTKFSDAGTPIPMEVLISTDYTTGNPQDFSWTPLTATWSPENSQQWTSSGEISLDAFPQKVRIAFHYTSSASGSSQWEIDEVKVKVKK